MTTDRLRIPDFYKLSVEERLRIVHERGLISNSDFRALATGKHTLEIKRKGSGPVYFNAYVTNFTLEDFITKAGLEVKVNRKYYKLTRVEEKIAVPPLACSPSANVPISFSVGAPD